MHAHTLLARLFAGVIVSTAVVNVVAAAQTSPAGPADPDAPVLPAGTVAIVEGIPIRREAITDLLWREWGPVYADYAIRSKIVRAEAAARGFTVTPEELQARMQEYQTQFNSVSGRQPRDWEMFVERFGVSTVEERQRDELLADKIAEEEARNATLTAEEKARVLADLKRAAHKVHARHVLVGIGPGYGGRTEAAARNRAEAAKARLASGADWKDVAREYSDDVSTREQGGDLGFFTREQMVKPLEDAAFAATPGETLYVIRVPEGFSVMQVLEREDKPPTEAEIQAAMDATLERKREIARTPAAWYPSVQAKYAVVRVLPYERDTAPIKAVKAAPKPAPKVVPKPSPQGKGAARAPARPRGK